MRLLLELYLIEVETGIVKSWNEFKKAHWRQLKHVKSYTHGMMLCSN